MKLSFRKQGSPGVAPEIRTGAPKGVDSEKPFPRTSVVDSRYFVTFITIVLQYSFWTHSKTREPLGPSPDPARPRPSFQPRPRAPRPRRPGSTPRPGPLLPEPINRTWGGGAESQATAEYQLVGPAVAHKVAPRTRLPPFPPPSLSEKTAVGPRRPPTTHRARRDEEPRREGGTAGRRRLRRRRRGAQPSQSHLRREQNGGAGGGPTVRRGCGHSPSAPTLTPAGPVRGSRLASPGAGREGRGAARPIMQSVRRRRRRRPVAKEVSGERS